MWWRAVIVVVVYHCVIGSVIVSVGLATDKPISYQQKLLFAVNWPIVVSATNYLQDKFSGTMNDIREILDEINSGRWERKP